MKKLSIHGKELRNSGRKFFIEGRLLTNANGDIDPNSTGFLYFLDTLSYIKKKVIDQKFYEVAPADYMPVSSSEGAYSSETVQNTQFLEGGTFYEGDIETLSGNGRITEVTSSMAPIRMPNIFWGKITKWNILEVAQAGNVKWDLIESRVGSLKKNWDLGIQEQAFLGHPQKSSVSGLLNNAEVNINLTVIVKKISEMTETEFSVFVAEVIGAYYANSNYTQLPDTFILPMDDFLGLSAPISPTFPFKDKGSYLLDAFKRTTGNQNFQIKGLAYSQASINSVRGISKNRYVLYKNDPETLYLNIPVEFRLLQIIPKSGFFMEQGAMGQYSGVLMPRPRQVLYFDYEP